MKTSPITHADLQGSVIAVPPLCRNADLSFNAAANAALIRHMRQGGIRSFMYAGNANVYNLGLSGLQKMVEMLQDLVGEDDWLVPGVGADFGKAAEQIDMLKDYNLPTVMALPLRFPSNGKGVALGLSALASRFGKPLIAYMKDDGYLSPEDLAALVRDGSICAVKYAIVREDPRQDAVLRRVLELVDPALIISGIGERPVIDHFSAFGLDSFTSGSCCVAPSLSDAIRRALLAGQQAEAARLRALFLPLEDLRDAYSPLRILHSAVRLAGIAESGPVGPYLSELEDPQVLAPLQSAAQSLLALELRSRSPQGERPCAGQDLDTVCPRMSRMNPL